MSENPYAPPGADLGVEPRGDTLQGRGDFDLGETLSDAWTNTWANFPLWLWVGIVGSVAAFLAAVTLVGVVLLLPVLGWGAILFVLRMHDGGAEFGDLFAGFSSYGTALVGILVVGLAFLLLAGVGESVQWAADETGATWLHVIGVPLSLVVSFFVAPRLALAYFYVVDRGVGPVEALQRSWDVTSPVKWKMVALLLLNYVVLMVGVLALVIGVIPASVMTYLMWASAYRQIEGRARPA